MRYLLIILCLVLTSCGMLVSDDVAIQALNDAGYNNVEIIGRHWLMPNFFGCGRDDDIAFDCKATNPKGARQEVTVCSSATFKGSTIRY